MQMVMKFIRNISDPNPQAEFYGDMRLFKGGKGGGGKAPSPEAQAAAQTKADKETAYWNAVLNNVNQITPYGNLTYTQTGGGKQYNMDAYNQAMQNYNSAIQAGANAGTPSRPRFQSIGGALANRNTGGGNYAGSMPKLEDFMTGEAPPQFTSTITLSPEQQQILDSQNRQNIAMGQLGEQQIGRIGQAVATPYSYENLQNKLPTYGSLQEMSAQYTDALMSRLNPQFARDEEALRTRLINQGIGQGSQAYQNEMDAFNQKQNDARIQSLLAGQQYGTADLNNLLGLRNQEINEYSTQRNAPLNEYIGLTSGTQVTNPQFTSGNNYQGINSFDIAGAMRNDYSNRQAAANNQSGAMSNLFGLGGAAIGGAFGMPQVGGFLGSAVGGLFSDERIKENIIEAGEENGFKLYEFNYKGQNDRYVGVMAQDVEKVKPEAVGEVNGVKFVNYDMIGVKMRKVI